MAWSTPLTAVSNASLLASQWNASVRDNLNETAVARATTAGRIFVSTGLNQIAERPVDSDTIDTAQTRTSTGYGDLTTVGPDVTATTGSLALIMYACQMSNNTTGGICYTSWQITGSSAVAAGDATSIHFESDPANQVLRSADVRRLTGLTPGSNTVTLKYRVSAGTGTFQRRHLIMIGL